MVSQVFVCQQGGSASRWGWSAFRKIGQNPPHPRYMGYYGIRSRSERYASYWNAFLCKNFFGRISVLFVGSLTHLFCTSGDIYPGFQSQSGFPCLHTSLPACNRFLRFISGATPAGLLLTSMAAKSFRSIHLRTSIGGAQIQDLSCGCLTACDKTDADRLSYAGSSASERLWHWS